MSDEQYPAAKLVTDEILNRITSESARLERRRLEAQETHRGLTKQVGEVKKQVALLGQVKQDMRGKLAEILSLDAAATQENRALASRERAVAMRETEMDRREEEVANLEQELREVKMELRKIIPMYNEQLHQYHKLENKHQQTPEWGGRLEVDYRLLNRQSTRYEKEAKGLSSQIQREREKNFDLVRKNAELAEQASHCKRELARYRGSPMTSAPSPTLSVATTTKVTPATRKPSGPLASPPVWARSTVASRARSSLSPPHASTFASSSDGKIRGQRHDGLSTSFTTASPAVRLLSRPMSEIGVSLAPSANSSDDGDVSPLLLPGAGPALNDRQQRRQQLFKARKKTDTYASTPIAAAARDKARAQQSQLKTASSTATLKSSVSVQAPKKQHPTTPIQKASAGVIDSSDLPFFSNVDNAFEAGSPSKDDEEVNPRVDTAQKRDTTLKVGDETPYKPTGSPYQKAHVKDDIESSSGLDDTVISQSFELPGLDLIDAKNVRLTTGGTAAKKGVPKLGSPIDIGKMTEQKVATRTVKKKGSSDSKQNQQAKVKKDGKRIDETDYKIKPKSFL